MERYHGGNLRDAVQNFGLQEKDFVDFSANINPLGPSPLVWTAIENAMKKIIHYPDPEGEALKAKLALYLGISKKRILLGNGGAELIYLLGSFFNPQRVILTAPTFGEYGQGIKNPKILRINLEAEHGFRLKLVEFQNILQPGDLIFIGNPNNPTGVLTHREVILKLAAITATCGATLVVDEAFMDFVEESQTIIREIDNYPQLIVVSSLTKIFALPGLRLGYLVAKEELVRELNSLLPPWRINTFAQEAGLVSLGDQGYLQASKELIKTEREFLSQGLKKIGFCPSPSAANFLLVDGNILGITGEEVQKYLGPKGLLIRLCQSFYNLNDYFFRVAIRTRQENEMLLCFLEELVERRI